MGNSDGNITVENTRPLSEMSKLSDVSKHLIFPSGNKDESRMMTENFAGKFSASLPQFFSTKVRGQLIAFPTDTFTKVPEVVDLRVEKATDKLLEKTTNAKFVVKPSKDDPKNATTGAKLKFGIDNILKSDSSEKPDKNPESSHFEKEPHFPQGDLRHHEMKGQERTKSADFSETKKKLNLEVPKILSNEVLLFQNGERSKNVPFPTRRRTHEIRHHPYSKSPVERSHSDPAWSPDLQSRLSPERTRGKSASPLRNPYSFSSSPNPSVLSSTVSEIQSNRYKSTEINSEHELKRTNPRPDNFSPPILRHDFKTTSPTHFYLPNTKSFATHKKSVTHPHGFALNDSFKSSRHLTETQKVSPSENDEVFKEDSIQKQKILASKNFEQILRQRNFAINGSNPHPTSPDGIPLMDQNKIGAMGFLPSLSQLHGAGLTGPPPSGINFQAWQNLPSNCHPAMFRHLINPYVYNQTAAAAVALSYFQSLKSVHTQGMMIPDNLRLSKSPPKPNFVFRTPENELHSSSDKNGGPRKRRKWTRAVFSILQRRALEDSFKGQKYVAKPERRFLAERLGLTDAQVKIWFQNRRMKWRQEQKSKLSVGSDDMSPTSSEENFRPMHAQT